MPVPKRRFISLKPDRTSFGSKAIDDAIAVEYERHGRPDLYAGVEAMLEELSDLGETRVTRAVN